MAKIPVKFKRVAAAFDEVARGRLCESSGSEHSAAAESFKDLSDLVNSFLEKDIREFEGGDKEALIEDGEIEIEDERNCSAYDIKDVLKNLLRIGEDDVKRKIHQVVEKAWIQVGNLSSPDSKRRLMTQLRDRGLDAGLCKSKWEKNGSCPSGSYEYIDVMFNGTRYIIELNLASEFEIARPTPCYTSLLENFQPIFVGNTDELKKIVKIMCSGIKKSMKSMDIHVPPWRRLAYTQAKWFGSYKRTTNEVSQGLNPKVAASTKRSIGFVAVPLVSYNCREDSGSKFGRKIGNLALALHDSSLLL